jgi:hypothetical protein
LIGTKPAWRAGPDEWAPVGRPEYLRLQAEMSLRRLGVERLDLSSSIESIPGFHRRSSSGFSLTWFVKARSLRWQ